MKPFKASSSSVEVNGQTVLSVMVGMGANSARAERILANHGIQQPKPEAWYPQQAWLDAFKEISEILGPNTLFKIGKMIPESAKFPPAIDSVHKALAAINMAYQMNHRGGEIGSYDHITLGDRSAKVVCRNPYPSDFDKGIIQAMAERFKPAGSVVHVEMDATQPSRKTGGESCTFVVKW